MRLFKTSEEYRNIILQCCNYLREICLNTQEGYKKPHGISGANLAIPFNIVGATRNRNEDNEYCQIMINPIILSYSNNEVITQSNCGSLTLENSINVKRSSTIAVEYYDENGNIHYDTFNRKSSGFSIQHEVDHNNGILIIDREIK